MATLSSYLNVYFDISIQALMLSFRWHPDIVLMLGNPRDIQPPLSLIATFEFLNRIVIKMRIQQLYLGALTTLIVTTELI